MVFIIIACHKEKPALNTQRHERLITFVLQQRDGSTDDVGLFDFCGNGITVTIINSHFPLLIRNNENKKRQPSNRFS